MHHRHRFSAALAVAALCLAPGAFAQEEDHSSLTVGMGVATVPSYEGSDDFACCRSRNFAAR